MVNMNDHNQGIIPLSMFGGFVDLAEHAFPRLWKYLCNTRNITGNGHMENSQLRPVEKQQVLLQIFALKRTRNPKALKWWSMIQAIAFYGWGVGHSALDATNYWGIVRGTTFSDKALADLTKTISQSLLHMRGGR